MRTRCLLWFFAIASLVIWSQAREDEEEDPGRGPVPDDEEGHHVDDDNSSNFPLVKRRHRHEQSRNRRVDGNRQLVKNTLLSFNELLLK